MAYGISQKIEVAPNDIIKRNSAGLFSINEGLNNRYEIIINTMSTGINQYRSTPANAHFQLVSLLSS